jgi:hypothetical protein
LFFVKAKTGHRTKKLIATDHANQIREMTINNAVADY